MEGFWRAGTGELYMVPSQQASHRRAMDGRTVRLYIWLGLGLVLGLGLGLRAWA